MIYSHSSLFFSSQWGFEWIVVNTRRNVLSLLVRPFSDSVPSWAEQRGSLKLTVIFWLTSSTMLLAIIFFLWFRLLTRSRSANLDNRTTLAELSHFIDETRIDLITQFYIQSHRRGKTWGKFLREKANASEWQTHWLDYHWMQMAINGSWKRSH